jgi:hypothetical protein
MPTLLRLPNEILFLIACALDSKGLCNLRLVSRNLNGVALPAISKRCFETRYVMLQQQSLENLNEISRHPVFRHALRILTICLDHLSEDFQDSRALPYSGDHARRLQERRVDHGRHDRNLMETNEEAVVDKQTYDSLLENQRFMMESGLKPHTWRKRWPHFQTWKLSPSTMHSSHGVQRPLYDKQA